MAVEIPWLTIPQVDKSEPVADKFIAALLEQCRLNKSEPQWLREIRQQSHNWLSGLSVPTRRDEDWRFLDLSSLTAVEFISNRSSQAIGEALPETSQSRLVFINGFYSAEQSDVSGLPTGAYVGTLADLPEAYNASQYFAQQPGADPFTALNTAGNQDIAVIWLERNLNLTTPIQIIHIADGAEVASLAQPRTLIVAATGSSTTLIEEFVGTGEYFTNSVTEIFIQDNARVNHTRLQQESETSYHIGKTALSQQRDSHYTLNEVNLGAKLMRHNPQMWQLGIQTETNFNGLTVATGVQTSDTHSLVALTQPQGITNQLHKCILGDRSHTVFNGKVFVPKKAQLTNATQLNRNLMLSPKARVDTKPELQITADNVKCAHGATVSQLEAEEIFYLQSRGLSAADANQLLIDAFTAEIVEYLSLKSLRNRVTKIIEQKIKKALS